MTLRFESLVVDAMDPGAQARWWGELLGWRSYPDDDGDWTVEPTDPAPGCPLLFQAVPEGKAVKNRLHLDLRPDDHAAEVAKAESMGATRADVGQTGDETWVVLADPEGNEFCILSSAG